MAGKQGEAFGRTESNVSPLPDHMLSMLFTDSHPACSRTLGNKRSDRRVIQGWIALGSFIARFHYESAGQSRQLTIKKERTLKDSEQYSLLPSQWLLLHQSYTARHDYHSFPSPKHLHSILDSPDATRRFHLHRPSSPVHYADIVTTCFHKPDMLDSSPVTFEACRGLDEVDEFEHDWMWSLHAEGGELLIDLGVILSFEIFIAPSASCCASSCVLYLVVQVISALVEANDAGDLDPATLQNQSSEHNSSNCTGRTSSFRRVWSIVFAKARLPTSGHGHGSSDTLMFFSTSERNRVHSALVYRAVMPSRLPSALFFSLPHSRVRRIMITHTRHYVLRTLDPGRRRRPQHGWRWPCQRGRDGSLVEELRAWMPAKRVRDDVFEHVSDLCTMVFSPKVFCSRISRLKGKTPFYSMFYILFISRGFVISISAFIMHEWAGLKTHSGNGMVSHPALKAWAGVRVAESLCPFIPTTLGEEYENMPFEQVTDGCLMRPLLFSATSKEDRRPMYVIQHLARLLFLAKLRRSEERPCFKELLTQIAREPSKNPLPSWYARNLAGNSAEQGTARCVGANGLVERVVKVTLLLSG
ncbi:hypothetical protein KC345_g326 [Hortaea werneckii]|nr:hypothetical protein KC345_g326 [Hortaea werneckii]